MDHWKKVYEPRGRLGFVRGLLEFTANHVQYRSKSIQGVIFLNICPILNMNAIRTAVEAL